MIGQLIDIVETQMVQWKYMIFHNSGKVKIRWKQVEGDPDKNVSFLHLCCLHLLVDVCQLDA